VREWLANKGLLRPAQVSSRKHERRTKRVHPSAAQVPWASHPAHAFIARPAIGLPAASWPRVIPRPIRPSRLASSS